jgi:hypothetical protein
VVLAPIPRWKIVTTVAVVVLLTATVVVVLWWAGTRGLTGKDLVAARLDALRVGLSVGVGGGGVFALFLAWRRQRSTEADMNNRERALIHQLQVAADTKAHRNVSPSTPRPTPKHDGSPTCTPRPSSNSAPRRPRSGWAGCTPWSGWPRTMSSSGRPS